MINFFGNLFRYHELLRTLVAKEITVRYKQSLLGPMWAIMHPLILLFLFSLINRFVNLESGEHPYVVVTFTKLLPWTFFATAISFSVVSITVNAGLITKVYFPRELFVAASVVTSLIDFFIASAVFAGFMIYYDVPFTSTILLVPVVLLVQLFFVLGLGLIGAALTVYKRDLALGMPFLIQFWLFATPVMYPLSRVPEEFKFYYLLNPMTGLVQSYQLLILEAKLPPFELLVSPLIASVFLFWVGYNLFKTLEDRFADVV